MKSTEFAYWLMGYFEISGSEELTKKQVEIIKKHLNLVFFHEIDPSYTNDTIKQEFMNAIHSGATLGSKLKSGEELMRC